MHSEPVLLRRTSSALPTTAGSGTQVDPGSSIPIADEDPGISLSASTHKRKQSGIPLEADAIIKRASIQTSLEKIRDEEEGSEVGGLPLTRSASEPEFCDTEREEVTRGSLMSEFSGLFSEGGDKRWSPKSLMSSRGVAFAALVAVAVALFALRPSSNDNASVVGAGLAPPSPPKQPGSKVITIGEYHDEEVGAPMEHRVHEYNKIRFFDSPSKMKPILSKGPVPFSKHIPGLHMFENVCLTNNVDALRYRPDPETGLRGLIYFTDDKVVQKNPKRCVPCSDGEHRENWDDNKKDENIVGHKCGMNQLHTMFASSVGDWSDCIMEEENFKLMERWGQTQSPVNVTTIHFFQEPTFVLQFNALDMEESLFDMLFTYLPHWENFLSGGGDGQDDGFPFDSVISHSIQGCLSHSHNWFCEVLHQMYAFGEAKEIPWEGDENTLYCYRVLFVNQQALQRNLDKEGLVSREVFGEFREMLFRKFGLPRRRTVEDRKIEAEYEKSQTQNGKKEDIKNNPDENGTKIIFYDNKLSERTVWNEMDSLIAKARSLEKYANIKFVTVGSFDDLTVAQQARRFNEADAIIMAHGGHMANAIFAVDGTSFVEVGCQVESLIGNPKFMELIDGKHWAIERCGDDGPKGEVCVKCEESDAKSINFTMSSDVFEKLIDDVVASLGE